MDEIEKKEARTLIDPSGKHPPVSLGILGGGVNDPWAHRSEGMRCKTCMWFVRKQPSDTVGRCRRHAPTMNGYPVVFITDWCGDHKLNETTL